MLERILNLKNGKNSISEFTESIRQGVPSAVFGVSDAFKNLLVSTIDLPVLYVVKDSLSALAAEKAIKELSGKKTLYIPSKDEILLSSKAFSKSGAFARIKALSQIKGAQVIIVTAETLMQSAPKKINSLTFSKNQEMTMEYAAKRLVELGYKRVEAVESAGSFAVRGDIIDLFTIEEDIPFRIDFFGDEIDNIKKFDTETRKSLGYVDSVTALQTLEYTFIDDDYNLLESLVRNALKQVKGDGAIRLKIVADDILDGISRRDAEAISALSPLSKDFGNILDLVDGNTVVVFDEAKRGYETAELYEREFTERYKALSKSGEVFPFADKNFCGLEWLKDRLSAYCQTALQTLSTVIPYFSPIKIINPSTSAIVNYQLDFKEVYTDIDNWLKGGYSVLVCTGDLRRADNFCMDLSAQGIASAINPAGEIKGVCITDKPLSSGFIFHEEKTVVIGSGNLYRKPPQIKKKTSKSAAFFTAPGVGDFCVHETHGIGRVLGNKKISTTEGTKDYVSVEYYGGDILYVPVEQMDILTRYLGGEKHPKLSKIGGADFERIKNAVKESIKKMSFDLKLLYSQRSAEKGFPFTCDKELEEAFESAFPFEDTIDQAAANQDIKQDMKSDKVMDRLICGDVGFGKTEVAFRAVFRAMVNGKQAVMLAPTTILTEQHYNTAVARFKGFGVKIACLNRFRTARQQQKILDDLKEGKIDFIIGTHRLLSKDVVFKDLGLLVLDEEQRFGVEHKEKIKLLKKNVDALTLTATPIPRTLHMSLSGIRSISVINTPPKKRLPVQTYVTEETEALIQDVVTREINRGGQVFILYNRVESIFSFAANVRALLPNLKITVVHGQMEESVMEKNILDFYNGQTDALISTTIIENGIDLPKANSLIVIDADRLGLSTLYQLKGRVGRSDRLAYAYFTFKRDKILSSTAYGRLNAIIEFTEMGSGIKIAMRDLEIRGAGNILGAQQHGHMDKIGYELYSKLLREELTGKEEVIPDLDVRLSAFIPEKYIENRTARMDAYKEIAEINSDSAEREFLISTEEAYGAIPIEMKNLIDISAVKRTAMEFGGGAVVITREDCYISFHSPKAFANEGLQKALDEFCDSVVINVAREPRVDFRRKGLDNTDILGVMRKFLSFAHEKNVK